MSYDIDRIYDQINRAAAGLAEVDQLFRHQRIIDQAERRRLRDFRAAVAYLVCLYRQAGVVPVEALDLLWRMPDPTGVDDHLMALVTHATGPVDPLAALREFAKEACDVDE